MVSITGISAGHASHYYSGKDNYYAKTEGQWHGKGAERLGLSGEVQKEDFEKLLNGQDLSDNQLVANGGENQSHRAGVDLTFSAPKSVSILSEVLGDDMVREAHQKAVSNALNYVERNFSQARQTMGGVTEKVDTGNLIIAKFDHNTSRELDPQLHTHAVVMNMTQRQDGQWRALSNEELFNNKMLIGQVYRNELAANLKELGYSIRSDQKGLFEIQGVDQKLLDYFSQRSEQVNAKVKELKESGLYVNANESKLREIATLGSRVAKKDVDINLVRESWQERLKEQGYSRESIKEATMQAAEQAKQAEQERVEPRLNEYDYIRMSAKALTEQESVFSKEDILRTAGKMSVGEYRMRDIENALKELSKDREIIFIGNEKDCKGLKRDFYTTPEMNKNEKYIDKTVRQGHNKAQAIETIERVQASLKQYEKDKGFNLTDDQKKAAEYVLTSKDKYIGIQGDAGVGKTTALNAIKEIAGDAGHRVSGMAFSGKAVDELEQGAKIKSQTIDSFLRHPEAARGMAGEEKQIWIVDEASMVGSRDMKALIGRAEMSGARVCFVGDYKQLQAIDAGKMFHKLQENGTLKTIEMKEITRQKDHDYKAAVKDFSQRKFDSAMSRLEGKGAIYEEANHQERMNMMVKDYTSGDYKNNLIVTARNDDRNELNNTIRHELKEQRKLKGQEHEFTVRENKGLGPVDKHFAQSYKGGEIIFTSKAGIAGRAGTEARISGIDNQNHALSVMTRDGKEHSIDLIKHGADLSIYHEKQIDFAEDDRIVFLKNDKGLGVQNGVSGTVQNIDEKGNIHIKTDSGKDVKFNINNQYNYIDHGYAVTDYKSQGQTSKEVIYHADTSKGENYNQAYVAITRGSDDLRIYTDNKEQFSEQIKTEQFKSSTLDYDKTSDKSSDVSIEKSDSGMFEKSDEASKSNEMSV